MAKTVSETLNYLMPASFDKTNVFYKALIADEDTDTGALTNEIKDAIDFINYYTRTQRVDEAETTLLEFLVYLFSGLTRHYSEPDDYLRLRYKALIERQRKTLWNSKDSIKAVFSYFFPEKDIYLLEHYPVNNLMINGGFDENMDGWTYYTPDTEFKLIYSRSFEGGAAIYINPNKPNPLGYMEQIIPNIQAGLYELSFFYSSSKTGIGDIQYTIRDSIGRYWNGSSWVTSGYIFYDIANEDTAAYYKPIEKQVSISSTTSITVRFNNKNGNGILIDSIRFGRLGDPAFRVYITTEPELFLDGSWKLDKTSNLSGFKKYYIQTDMMEILNKIKPAGVHAEMTLLASRLNIPWDRVLLTWESTIRARWHRMLDATWSLNNGSVYFANHYLDGGWALDNEYNLDAKKMERENKPIDILLGTPRYYHTRTYKKRFTLQTDRKLYMDGRIGLNGKFNLAGEIIGTKIGYSEMRVTKWAQRKLEGKTYLNNTWTLNSGINLDGKYTYWQNGTETYLMKEVL